MASEYISSTPMAWDMQDMRPADDTERLASKGFCTRRVAVFHNPLEVGLVDTMIRRRYI